MSGIPLELPFLKSIGLAMTFRCPISCAHCIVRAGPQREEEMSLEEAFEWIRQIACYRNGHIKMLSLTGGEPFHDLNRLEKLSSFAKSQGLIVSAVTNAYWATDPQTAVELLKRLPAIQVLSLSTDVYHQEFIPLGCVENALSAAKECDLSYNVHICAENEEDGVVRCTKERLEIEVDRDLIFTSITLPVGRAVEKVSKDRYSTTEKPPKVACSSASTPIIFPDGTILACCGAVIDLPKNHPLVLGNLHDRSLGDILDRAEKNFIVHSLRIWGPAKIVSIAEEAGFGSYLPKAYVKDSLCNACYQLLSIPKIVDLLTRKSEDPEFRQKVAYARAYYLKEINLVEALPP